MKCFVIILGLFMGIQVAWCATCEELEAKVLSVYNGDYLFREKREVTFSNFPPVCIFVYQNARHGQYTPYDLWEFSRKNEDSSYTLLLPADLNPMGIPPTLYYVQMQEDDVGADIALLAKFDGTGMVWGKYVYRYTGESIELKNTFYGYEDAPHADPVTGKAMRTAPTWWDPDGSPMISQADRLKQDEQGNTWRLVSDEAVEEDHSPPTRKAIMYRRDSDTGYWWKNLSE